MPQRCWIIKWWCHQPSGIHIEVRLQDSMYALHVPWLWGTTIFFFSSWSPLCKSLLQTPGRLNWLILDLAPEMHFIHRLRLSENPTPENKQSAKKRKKKQVNVNGLLLYIMNFVFQQFLKQLSFFYNDIRKEWCKRRHLLRRISICVSMNKNIFAVGFFIRSYVWKTEDSDCITYFRNILALLLADPDCTICFDELQWITDWRVCWILW